MTSGMMMTKEQMRARYWELEDLRDAVIAKSKPLRDQRVKLEKEMEPIELKLQELKKAIIDIERPDLPAIDQERAMIVKAIGARIGERPGKEKAKAESKDDS